jgi:hypothetical protein
MQQWIVRIPLLCIVVNCSEGCSLDIVLGPGPVERMPVTRLAGWSGTKVK